MTPVPVPLHLAYRLLNHGPTTLVSARAGERRNAMAAQWVMPLDYAPCKLAVVVDATTHTRALVDAAGALTLAIPEARQAALVWRLGSTSGAAVDKLAGVPLLPDDPTDPVGAPRIAGCLAWLACRVVRGPALDDVARAHDLFVVEAVAAWADPRYFHDERVDLIAVRTLHHLGGGRFVASGQGIDGRAGG